MTDQLRADELKSGTWIKTTSLRGFPWQKVTKTEEVGRGPVCAIIRISFSDSGFDLMANADRVFEAEHEEPAEMIALRTGMFVPGGD